jgi:hypothetical protein
MMRKLSDLRNMRWNRREIQRARESEFDAAEDRIAEAIRDGVLGPVSWSFIDLLTRSDMDWLAELRISWRSDDGR